MKYGRNNFMRRPYSKRAKRADFSQEDQQLLEDICSELNWMVGEKTPIYVEQHRSSINEVAQTLVRNKGKYMADFEKDDDGNLLCVRYNKIL